MTETFGVHEIGQVETPPFNVETIEQQINAAWSELGARAEREGASAPLRTSILTLVVIANGEQERDRASSTLQSLVQALPSRVIHVSISPANKNITAEVSAHCMLKPGDKPSCYEIIEIEAGPSHLAAIPSILTQLDISDLKTFVWWVGPADPRSDDFRRIAGIAQRIIIDSARFPDPLPLFSDYASYVVDNKDVIACSDLSWSRLLVFRELVAQSFDVPAAQNMLTALNRIEMSYRPDSLPEALLMAGWITSRLAWTPTSASEREDTLTLRAETSSGRSVSLQLVSASRQSGGLRSIRLHGHSSKESSRVTIRKVDDTRAAVNIDITGMSRQQRIVHCGSVQEDQILGMEIMQFDRDQVFEESLHHASVFASLLLDER